MPNNFNIIVFSIILSFIYSEIEYYQCENGKRKIKLEDETIKEYLCITCPEGQYTTYNNTEATHFICQNCTEGTSNYGQNIIIDSFSKKLLSRYNFKSSSECSYIGNNDELCPEWIINPLFLRVDYKETLINLKTYFTINQYYMNEGELIIKYINYNGGIDKYFNIYINNKLLYKDDSDHSIIKVKKFNINKGRNILKFEYIVDSNLASKGNKYDDNSYLEIFEIQMINAEMSSLECQKYDPLNSLKETIHNNCEYYIEKCSNDIICTFRFYTEERDKFCNYLEGSQNIKYNKITQGVCKEIIPPSKDEVECEHCTLGQYLSLSEKGDESKCLYCNGNSYNNEKVHDEVSCDKVCDVTINNNKQINKILYITSFEDHSEYSINEININVIIGYIEVNYVKFNEKDNCNIFIEINSLNGDANKTIELINPDENNYLLDYYIFNIPIPKGEYNITIKGKNLKLNKISIIGTQEGGNYKCVDKLNTEEEETCPNEDEHYFPIKKCSKCINGSIIDLNKECIFIEQFIDNKFILENNLLYNKILSSSFEYLSDKEEYFLNLNPTNPLIYYINKTDNTGAVIIGKELYKVRIVKGIHNRGIILSYLSVDNNLNYITNVFLKCSNTTNMKDGEKILLNKKVVHNDTIYLFFIFQTNYTCPYCLDSEITYKVDNSKCINNQQLVNITIKEDSLCVIKPYDNSTDSKLINDSNILLNINSSEEEDKLIFDNYNIDEDIPINYEKDDDEIYTSYQKNITCEYKRRSILEMGTGIFILIIIACAFGLILIGVIIWKCIDNAKKKHKKERTESLTELSSDIKKDDKDEKKSLL